MHVGNSASFSKVSGFREFFPRAKQSARYLDCYYFGYGAKPSPVLPGCLSLVDPWASGFLSLGIGSQKERRLCLCQKLELTSISRRMPGNFTVLFKRTSCKRESSELGAFPPSVHGGDNLNERFRTLGTLAWLMPISEQQHSHTNVTMQVSCTLWFNFLTSSDHQTELGHG